MTADCVRNGKHGAESFHGIICEEADLVFEDVILEPDCEPLTPLPGDILVLGSTARYAVEGYTTGFGEDVDRVLIFAKKI